jgi:hypothetical protein
MKDSRLVIALARGEVAGLLSFIMNGGFLCFAPSTFQ